MAISDIVQQAKKQLRDLTGHEVESVFGLERAGDGWSLRVEAVEVSRVPNTQDLLGMYEVSLDANGDLEGYERVGMRIRGAAGSPADV